MANRKHSETPLLSLLPAGFQFLGLDTRPATDPDKKNVRLPVDSLAEGITRTTEFVDTTQLVMGQSWRSGTPAAEGYTVFALNDPVGAGAFALYFYTEGGVRYRQLVYANTYTGNPLTTAWVNLDGEFAPRRFDPDRDYQVGEQVVSSVTENGELVDLVFTARMALNRSDFGGLIPAPTGATSDPNWSRPPAAPRQHPQNTDVGTTARGFSLNRGTTDEAVVGVETWAYLSTFTDEASEIEVALGLGYTAKQGGGYTVRLGLCADFKASRELAGDLSGEENVWVPLPATGGVPRTEFVNNGTGMAVVSGQFYYDGTAEYLRTGSTGVVETLGGIGWKKVSGTGAIAISSVIGLEPALKDLSDAIEALQAGGGSGGPAVVQTLGQSTTAVMSQKAVTDVVNGLDDALGTLQTNVNTSFGVLDGRVDAVEAAVNPAAIALLTKTVSARSGDYPNGFAADSFADLLLLTQAADGVSYLRDWQLEINRGIVVNTAVLIQNGSLYGKGNRVRIVAGGSLTLENDAPFCDMVFEREPSGQLTLAGPLSRCFIPDGALLAAGVYNDCIFLGGAQFTNGTVRLGPGTTTTAQFFNTLTNNGDGTYTTDDGGTVVDERGSGGGSGLPAGGTATDYLRGDGTWQPGRGQNNGLAELDASGLVPVNRLPSTVVELVADFPVAGTQSVKLRINTPRKVGTVSLSSFTATLLNISYKKNGAATAMPTAVVLNDEIEVLATADAAGGTVILNVN